MHRVAGNTAGAPTILAFGVACFHFGFTPNIPYFGTLGDYADKVRSALNRVQNINNVRVELAEGEDHKFAITEEVDGGIEKGQPFPLCHFFLVEFELYIPFRIQKEVFPSGEEQATGTENFKIYIRHAYDSPICFVVPVGMAETSIPSSSIPVVREFLKREMNRDSEIKFGALGPSPMHANFYLKWQKENGGELLEVAFFRSTGYARVVISADPSAYPSLEEAFDDVRFKMSDEVDAFYAITQIDVRARFSWRKLEDDLNDLTSNVSGIELRERIRRAWGRSEKLAKLHGDLARFEASMIIGKHKIDAEVGRLYRGLTVQFIKPIIDDELADRTAFPTSQVGRLVEFLEQRRSKAVELIIVLVSAVIGGIAGSVLALSSAGG